MNDAILASYVTYKELYKTCKYKSQYYILAEFIKECIISEQLYSFSNVEIQTKLLDNYGFVLPLSVVEASIKKIDGISRANNCYRVNFKDLCENEQFVETIKQANENQKYLSEKMNFFQSLKLNERKISPQELQEDLVHFLLDEECKLQEIIGEFVLKSCDDKKLLEIFNTIREGSILYQGLNYNINEMGSFPSQIVLYLDMEVLFDISGYNGDAYKCLAVDMLSLVSEANKKDKKILLKYYKETEKEIDKFFNMAERIVEGEFHPILKPAMQSIVNGCKDRSDVIDKKASFFFALKNDYHIIPDDTIDYYKPEFFKYNIEGINLENEEIDDEYNESLLYLSHINVHRKNELKQDLAFCESIFITETNRTIDISSKLIKYFVGETDLNGKTYIPFAIRMGNITNYLWLKLNRGFGNQCFPTSADVLMKAKFVLANGITQNIMFEYEQAKKAREDGSISDEEFASRVLSLKDKKSKPEELNATNYDEINDFSISKLNAFLLENKENKAKTREILKQYNDLKQDYSNAILEKDATLKQYSNEIDEKDKIISDLQVYKDKDEQRQQLFAKIIWFLKMTLIVAFIGIIVYFVANNYIASQYAGVIGGVASVISLILYFWKKK